MAGNGEENSGENGRLYDREFRIRSTDIHAVIGPGITMKNFEVGQEVYDAFADAAFDMPSIARKMPVMNALADGPSEKWHIDASAMQPSAAYQCRS